MHLAKSVAVVVIAAAASGGIALAAASPSGAPSQPGRDLPSTAASQAQEHAAPKLSAHPSGKAPKSHGNADDHPAPSPNLNGLCHAWLAGAGSKHGKARSNPAFTALITAAGGPDKVAGYCATIVKAHSSDETSDEADHPARPTHANKSAHPGRGPGGSHAHPAGPPSGIPSKSAHS
jgi:hypothetical protein